MSWWAWWPGIPARIWKIFGSRLNQFRIYQLIGKTLAVIAVLAWQLRLAVIDVLVGLVAGDPGQDLEDFW